MTPLETAQKISTRFRDLVEIPSGVPTQHDNEKLIHPEDSLWMRCAVIFTGGDLASLGTPGTRTLRDYGLLSVEIFTPIERGDADALELSQTILAAFRGVKADGISYRPSASIVQPGMRTPDEKWWKINIVCPWYLDKKES